MLVSCVIYINNDRDARTCDISGVLMQVDMDEILHIQLTGTLATILAQIDPNKHEKCIVHEK